MKPHKEPEWNWFFFREIENGNGINSNGIITRKTDEMEKAKQKEIENNKRKKWASIYKHKKR